MFCESEFRLFNKFRGFNSWYFGRKKDLIVGLALIFWTKEKIVRSVEWWSRQETEALERDKRLVGMKERQSESRLLVGVAERERRWSMARIQNVSVAQSR